MGLEVVVDMNIQSSSTSGTHPLDGVRVRPYVRPRKVTRLIELNDQILQSAAIPPRLEPELEGRVAIYVVQPRCVGRLHSLSILQYYFEASSFQLVHMVAGEEHGLCREQASCAGLHDGAVLSGGKRERLSKCTYTVQRRLGVWLPGILRE